MYKVSKEKLYQLLENISSPYITHTNIQNVLSWFSKNKIQKHLLNQQYYVERASKILKKKGESDTCKIYNMPLVNDCNRKKCPGYENKFRKCCLYLDTNSDTFIHYNSIYKTQEYSLDFIIFDKLLFDIFISLHKDVFVQLQPNKKYTLGEVTDVFKKYRMLELTYKLEKDFSPLILQIPIDMLYSYIEDYITKNTVLYTGKDLMIKLINHLATLEENSSQVEYTKQLLNITEVNL